MVFRLIIFHPKSTTEDSPVLPDATPAGAAPVREDPAPVSVTKVD